MHPQELISNPRQVRILIIMKDPRERKFLRETLRIIGFNLINEVHSAAAALSCLQRARVDLIVSDIQVSGLTATGLLRQIRSGKTQAPRDLRFIILTSNSDTKALRPAMALDVNGFIVKPLKAGVILDRINRTASDRIMLRSESEYGCVSTDPVRSVDVREKIKPHAESAAAAVGLDGLQKAIDIPFNELQPEMCVAKDITAKDDSVIIAAETILSEVMVKLLGDLQPLIADQVVRIYRPPKDPDSFSLP